MPKVTCLYIDDSGTRNPNRKPDRGQYRDWFSLGGMMIHEEREDEARRAHREFCAKWNINYPLHSYDIRQKEKRFSWLGTLPKDVYDEFMSDLSELMINVPVIGHGCVIDRPGYEMRYRKKYGRQQWMLCKTAFAVICERAAKIARLEGRKLRVFPEACDPTADEFIRAYYRDLRAEGMPFIGPDAQRYDALSTEELSDTLYELRFKNKTSPMAQVADLYLYPISRGGYQEDYLPYRILADHRKLIDAHLAPESREHLGVKYSCFELVRSEKEVSR